MWVAIVPPPGTAALPSTIERRRPHFDLDAVDGQAVGHRGEAVAFLHPQLGEAAHAGAALGEGRGDGEDRIFVDHRRARARGHVDALERAGPHAQIADVLAAVVAAVLDLDVGAHVDAASR